MKQKLITEYFTKSRIFKKSYNNINSYNNVQKKIKSKYKINNCYNDNNIIRGYNEITDSWHCMECGIDMGSCNPRQLCGKTYCPYS